LGLRLVFHERYAVYYRPIPTEAVVKRVLHGARDARAVAERGGLEG
jgi:toxin ParE1/3/4